MKSEAELRSLIKRQRLLYRVADIGSRLFFGSLAVGVAIAIVVEAYERAGLLAVIIFPVPVLAFYAFLLPNDYVQPFIDWRNSIEGYEQELNDRFGR